MVLICINYNRWEHIGGARTRRTAQATYVSSSLFELEYVSPELTIFVPYFVI